MAQICLSHPYFVFLLGISVLEKCGSLERVKWTREDYPNPFLNPGNCSRIDPSYVCDPDNVLTKEEADQLDFIITKIRNDTTCICRKCKFRDPGISVSVALMKYIAAGFSVAKEEKAKDFAVYLRHRWNFGQCDDDVVVLVSSADHQSYVAVGATVSSVLPNELADNIYESSKNHFANQYIYQGLESIVESYYDVLRRLRRSSVKEKKRTPNNKDITIALVVSVATLASLLLFLAVLLYRMKRRHRKATSRSNLSRWRNPKQIKVEDYKSCNTDERVDDGNGDVESLEDIDDDINQTHRIYSINKRQLSAVMEESENEDDDEKNEVGPRTLNFNQKLNVNNVPRIPRFQHSDNPSSVQN